MHFEVRTNAVTSFVLVATLILPISHREPELGPPMRTLRGRRHASAGERDLPGSMGSTRRPFDQLCIDEHADAWTWVCCSKARNQLAKLIGDRQGPLRRPLGRPIQRTRSGTSAWCTVEGETTSP